jgi:hypothetical protein
VTCSFLSFYRRWIPYQFVIIIVTGVIRRLYRSDNYGRNTETKVVRWNNVYIYSRRRSKYVNITIYIYIKNLHHLFVLTSWLVELYFDIEMSDDPLENIFCILLCFQLLWMTIIIMII